MTNPHLILLVDDTPASLVLLTKFLTAEGFQVISAGSGELALASVAAHLPDLIILDIRMPEMDGFEVCRRLKADARTHDIPVIFITAFNEIQECVAGFKLGAVDYITKPFQREEYIARISNHLRMSQTNTLLKQQASDLQRSHHELARLYRTTGSLISPKPFDLTGLAYTIVNTIVQEFENANCCLHLINKNSDELFCPAYAGKVIGQYASLHLRLDGPGLIPLAMRTQQLINAADVTLRPEYVNAWNDARSELVVPLLVNDRAIGAIDLESSRLANFTADDEKLLWAFANQAAIVLENTYLMVETHLQIQRLKSLQIIDASINTSLDLSATTDVVLDQVINQLNVDAADILIFDPTTGTFKTINARGFNRSTSPRPGLQTGIRTPLELADRILQKRQVIHLSNIGLINEGFQGSPFVLEEHFNEYYGVPLISKEKVKGLLEIFHRSPMKTDTTWLDFLQTLAGQAAIAIDNIEMFENLQRSNQELILAYDATIEGWSRTLDLRNKETEGHTRRVTEITVRLAQSIGASGEDLIHIRRGALLHDIGKMGIPDTILLKTEELTDEELTIIRKHPGYALAQLAPVTFLKPALDIPYCHHEKWDGSGYPRGLKGERIPLPARLFAIAEVWDALTSDRPYRAAWPDYQAIDYIREQSGKYFDPQVVELFLCSEQFEGHPLVKPVLLVVDEDKSVIQFLSGALKERFTLISAGSGEEALSKIEQVDPALVLTEQRMTGMTGLELLGRIRSAKPRAIGILMSDFADATTLAAAINLTTVRGFVHKPLNLDQLIHKLDETFALYRLVVRRFESQ